MKRTTCSPRSCSPPAALDLAGRKPDHRIHGRFRLYCFEPTLDQIVATAVLFPIVMSMGGIAGTQTLTLMMRGMATGQVSASNTPALLRKELAVGLLNGIVFSMVIAAIAMIWYDDIAAGPGDGGQPYC